MNEVAIADIKVGERMRKQFDGIVELAESIRVHGQIEPVVLDENNLLIVGERRIRALLHLRRDKVLAVYMNQLTELQKKEVELEENIQRANFTWQEEVNAKLQLHEIKQAVHGKPHTGGGAGNEGKWGLKDTAMLLGESTTNTSVDLALAKGLKAFPTLLKEKNKAAAVKIMKKEQTRIIQEEVSRRLRTSEAVAHPDVRCGDCIIEMQKMEAESVDLIISDPPYGIDVDNAHTFGRMTNVDTNFDDSEFATFDLLDKAFKEMYRVLKNDRHMYVFFAMSKYEAVITLLKKHGFNVHHIPLIWDKGSGSYPSQSTTFVHSYEPFLHCWKGKRKLNGTPRDIFEVKRVPSGQKVHPTQKPTELLRDLIGFSSNIGETVFDPFAGSGATLVAAKEVQRKGIGIELNPVYHKAICDRLENKEVDAKEIQKEALAIDPDMELELEEGE